MEANRKEGENITMNHPLMILSSSQTLTMNPTNPTPVFNIPSVDEHNNESSESEDQSPVSQTNSGIRLRGRPPGSRNKAKPAASFVIYKDSPNSLQSVILEITPGADIIEVLRTYAQENHCGITVMYSAGMVKNVTNRNLAAPEGVIRFPGNHRVLSLHGAFLPFPSPPVANGLTVFLAGGHGQVLGGIAVGRLTASEPVTVIAASFSNATFQRLPIQSQVQPNTSGANKKAKKTGTTGGASTSSGGPQPDDEDFVGYWGVAPSSPPPAT